jgi:hypothetical protein
MARRWVELRKRGVELIQRETSESALRTGRTALERLGVAPYEARERADRYRRHKIAALDEMLPYFGDETRRLSAAKAGREQLERQFAEERAALDRSIGAWSFETEMADDRFGRREPGRRTRATCRLSANLSAVASRPGRRWGRASSSPRTTRSASSLPGAC